MGTTLDPTTLAAAIEDARELLQRGSPARSRTRYRAILARIERVGDPGVEIRAHQARLLLGMAAAEFDLTGDFALATGLLNQAAELAASAGARELQTSIHGQRGLLCLRRGDTAGALAALDLGAASLDFAPVYDQMTLLLNRGTLHLERGDLSRAVADLERCVAIAGNAGERLVEFKARHNLGYAEFLAGRLPRALAVLDAAERVNPGDPSPIAMLDRARVLREAGLVRDADSLLAQAGELLEHARLVQDLAESELARGECALVEGRPRESRALATRALRRFVRRGNVRWQRRAELLVLRCDRALAESRPGRARLGALRAVAGRADELARACRAEGRRELARTAGLLALDARLGTGMLLTDALEEGHERAGATRLVPSDPLERRLQTHEVRARAALNAGSRPRALTEVRRGLAELGSYQQALGSLDLRTASAVHGAALARLGLAAAWGSGRPDTVFGVVELARAVSIRLPRVVPPRDDRTADLLAELRQVEEEARARVGDPAAESQADRLRQRAAQLQRAVRARSWQVEGREGDVVSAPSLRDVREVTEPDRAFVTLARHDGDWVGVVAAGGRAGLARLAEVGRVSGLVQRVRADLDALARPGLPDPIRAAVRRSLETGLDQLDALICRPLSLGDRPVVLSCSGDLVFLPWTLLPSRRGHSTVVTPSAATWLRGARQTRPARPRITAVSGPDLRRSHDEAHAVAAVWGDALHLGGEAATGPAVEAALASSDLVHVAAHGVHRQDSPLFSSLRLAGGPLYAYDLDGAVGRAGCVVLSACEAGLATFRPGDESLGLTQVLLQLGVHSVVAGVARVNDDVAATSMARLHQLVRGGTDIASALGEVQQKALEGPAPAAFATFGGAW